MSEQLSLFDWQALSPNVEPGDHTKERSVDPDMNLDIQTRFGTMSAEEIIDTARTFGVEIVSLCGDRFIPNHIHNSLRVCKDCEELVRKKEIDVNARPWGAHSYLHDGVGSWSDPH